MPVLDRQSLEFISRSAEQTRRVGMRLGALLHPGDLVCLIGDLGAGKTTLVQGLAAGWGSLDAGNSPTFVLVNVYRRPEGMRPGSLRTDGLRTDVLRTDVRLYHLDAYRLSGPAEAEDLDLDTLLESGPLVVEWADRIQAALPDDHLQIKLSWVDENQRDMLISAVGRRYESLLGHLRRQIFGVQ